MDMFSYLLGFFKGLKNGKAAATGSVEITGGITCTDDGEGNITITESE